MKIVLKYVAMIGAAGALALAAMGPASARIHHRGYDAYASDAYAYSGSMTPGNSYEQRVKSEGN